jgi:hypothetical protein
MNDHPTPPGFDSRGITSPNQPLQQPGPAERLFGA